MELKVQNGDHDYILKLKKDLITAKIIIVVLAIIGVALFITSYNEANAIIACIK